MLGGAGPAGWLGPGPGRRAGVGELRVARVEPDAVAGLVPEGRELLGALELGDEGFGHVGALGGDDADAYRFVSAICLATSVGDHASCLTASHHRYADHFSKDGIRFLTMLLIQNDDAKVTAVDDVPCL